MADLIVPESVKKMMAAGGAPDVEPPLGELKVPDSVLKLVEERKPPPPKPKAESVFDKALKLAKEGAAAVGEFAKPMATGGGAQLAGINASPAPAPAQGIQAEGVTDPMGAMPQPAPGIQSAPSPQQGIQAQGVVDPMGAMPQPIEAQPTLLEQPNPEAERPAPVSAEKYRELRSVVESMTPEQRLAAESLPGWQGTAIKVLNRQLAAAQDRGPAEPVAASPQQVERAAQDITTRERQAFAKENPHVAGMQSGLAQGLGGVINAPAAAAAYLNELVVNPVLAVAGLEKLGRTANMPGSEYFARAAADYMPEAGKGGAAKHWEDGDFTKWLTVNMAAQAPQMIQMVTAAMVPPLRAALLPAMGATSAGSSYQQGDSGAAAVSKGIIEAGTELLPLGVFDKAKEVILALPPAARGTVVAEAVKRLTAAGAAVTASTLTESIEEAAAQVGQNLVDKGQGKTTPVGEGVLDAAILGGAMGGGMGAPNAAAALNGNEKDRAEREIAKTIDRAASYFARKPVDDVPLTPSKARGESIRRLDELAAHFGLRPAALAKVKEAAGELPAEEVPGFLARATNALQKRGMFARPVDEAGLTALDDAVAAADQAAVKKPKAAPAPAPAAAAPAPQADDGPVDASELLGTLDEEANKAATSPLNDLPEPTDGQKEAGNYRKGHVVISGMDVSIENPKGSMRRSKADAPTPWEVEMPAHYGYIRGTVGSDGDHVDLFIGPKEDNGRFWIVNQNHVGGTKHDEHKVITGVDSPAEAEAIYRGSFVGDFASKVFGSISGELDADALKAALPELEKPKAFGVPETKPAAAAPAAPRLSSVAPPPKPAAPAVAAPVSPHRILTRAGRTPNAATPIELRANADGTLTPWHEGYALADFDSGDPLVLPAGVSDIDAKTAIRASGALSKRINFFAPNDQNAQGAPAAPAAEAAPAQAPAAPAVDAGAARAPAAAGAAAAQAPRIAKTRAAEPFAPRDLNDDVRGPAVLEDSRLSRAETRKFLQSMPNEAGWAQVGGQMLRAPLQDGQGIEGAVVGRTPWIPASDWYGAMQRDASTKLPNGKAGVQAAIDKAVAGEPLTTQERRAVRFMLEQAEAESDPLSPLNLARQELLDAYDRESLGLAGVGDLSPDGAKVLADLLDEAENLGLDTETIREDAARQHDDDAAYHQAVTEAITQALAEARGAAQQAAAGRAVEGAEGGRVADGEQAAPALTLEAPTRAQVVAQQEALEREQAERDAPAPKPASRFTGEQVDLLNPQGSIFDQPAEPPAPAPTPSIRPETSDSEAVRQAKADALKALGDLADLLGSGGKAFITPEQEQKLMPVLTRLMDAAFRLGYLKFKQAAKFALDQIRSALGDAAADAVTLEHLQGAYIGMAGRYRDQGADNIMAVGSVASKADIEKGERDVPSTDGDLERDREDAAPADRNVAPAVPAAGVSDGAGGGRSGGAAGEGRSGRARDSSVPAGGAAAAGERGGKPVRRSAEQSEPSLFDAGADDAERGTDSGEPRVPAETIAAEQVEDAAAVGLSDPKLRAQQRAAEGIAIAPGIENIRATLPYLLEGQQDDVLKAETRFAKEDGYGMLFTNGTGTGKTFTGLGIVKRWTRQGKGNVLIVVPDEKIAADWIDSGVPLGLSITALGNTKESGKGVTITTYANLGANDTLAARAWDGVVVDEAHMLMQSAHGEETLALSNLRALTLNPRGEYQRYVMLNRKDIDAMSDLSERIDSNDRIRNLDDTMDAHRDALAAENKKLAAQHAVIAERLRIAREKNREHVAANQGVKRPRVVALSATPFAYEKTVDWADGLLFDYETDYPEANRQSSRYNNPSPFQYFMMTHFGYHMKNGKLNEPDAKVDRGLLQRQFNTWLRKSGALSGRTLDVKPDYDRRFVLVESAVGNDIDRATEWLRERSKEAYEASRRAPVGKAPPDGYGMLREVISSEFDGPLGHLTKRYFLEAIKAKEAIQHVREHMALGRKVVVFHDFKKGGAVNPFNFGRKGLMDTANLKGDDLEQAEGFNENARAYNQAAEAFEKEFPALSGDKLLADLQSPIERFRREFPGVLLINGDEKRADLLQRYARFQDDSTGPLVALVQSAKNKGWSGHDTTGRNQRTLFNLGLPTQPTMTIQQEGRIYRTGQASDAMFRYFNTGTNWERRAFAQTIANRASTAENLASGEQARALKDAFITSFEDSGDFRAGHEGEGKGGKENDRITESILSEFDRARAFYWATQKKNSRTKAQEGKDYFATPEPIGLKMVQWLDLKGGDDALEPSGGHGAIARWFGETTNRTAIEPSDALSSRLALVFDGKIIRGNFEDHDQVNKYDGIAMNPPFGVGGKLAIEHLDKAARLHLRDGGRVAALIPTGPAADKRFDDWFYGEQERPAKPLGTAVIDGKETPIYKGDTIESRASWAPVGVVVSWDQAGPMVKATAPEFRGVGASLVTRQSIKSVQPTGARKIKYRAAAGLHLVAEIKLPQVTFERAGTAVATRIVVIEKQTDEKKAPAANMHRADYSSIDDINALFDRIEDKMMPPRVHSGEPRSAPPAAAPAPTAAARTPTAAPAQPAAAAVKMPEKGVMPRNGLPTVEHVTGKGKTLLGVVRTDITFAQAKEIDPYTFRKDGGFFIREKYVADPPADDVAFMRSQEDLFSAQPFYSELARQLEANQMNGGSAGAWKNLLKGMTNSGKVKADEVAWSGIEEWLDLQPGKVAKADVLAYLKTNGVQVTETVLGASVQKRVDQLNDLLRGTDYEAEYDGSEGEIFFLERGSEDSHSFGDLPDEIRSRIGPLVAVHDSDVAKYSSYTLPGGTNYREVLLTLPVKKDGPLDLSWRQNDDGKWAWFSNGKQVSGAFRNESDSEAARGSIGAAASPAGVYKSGHWDQPNVLAHIRLNDRTDADGKRVLFVEEIQSDWAQHGKKVGFQDGGEQKRRERRVQAGERSSLIERARRIAYEKLVAQGIESDQAMEVTAGMGHNVLARVAGMMDEYNNLLERENADRQDEHDEITGRSKPPRAPFVNRTDAWVALAIKRVIVMAADAGYDRVAFINGEQSAQRYDLSKHITSLAVYRDGNGFKLSFTANNGDTQPARNVADAAELADTIGKELAERAIADLGERRSMVNYTGLDLKVGGEGMKAFYDKIVPSVAKDVLRKLGGSPVGTVQFAESDHGKVVDGQAVYRPDNERATSMTQLGFDITPAMREKAAGGLPLFRREARSAGMQAAEVRSIADAISSQWANAPEVVVLDTFADAPRVVQEADAKQRAGDAAGDPHSFVLGGKVYLVAGSLSSPTEVVTAMLHEALGHLGLRGFFGAELGNVLDRMAESLPERMAVKAKQYGLSLSIPAERRRVAEELLSEIAQTRPSSTWVQRAIAAIKSWLRSHIPAMADLSLSDAEIITQFIEPARRFIEQGQRQTVRGGAPAFMRGDDAFRRWFGDSKVVDAEGKPLVVYHGTTRDFSEFKTQRGLGGAVGFWFASTPEAGSRYAEPRMADDTANVRPVYLALTNPAMFDDYAAFQAAVAESGAGAYESRAKALRRKLEGRGHDGIVIRESETDGAGRRTDYVAFHPEQIKSAIGNRGTYDPTNPDIAFRRSGTGTLRPSTGVLDTALRFGGGGLLARLTSPAYSRTIRFLDRAFDSVWSDGYQTVKAGLVDNYGLAEPYLEAKQGMKTAVRRSAREIEDVLDALQDLDRAQSRIAYLWMQEKPDAAEEQRLLAELPEPARAYLLELKDRIDALGREAVELGMLSADTYDRNKMAYLHRSYARYELENKDAKAARARSVKIQGDQFKGRGMRDDATMSRIGSPDWFARKTKGQAADVALKGAKFVRLERRSVEATPDMVGGGVENRKGKLLDLIYWPAGEPIPGRYADWHNDGEWEARFFNKAGKVGMWRDFTLDERTRMGEIQDVRYSVAKTMMQATRDIETARLLDWVARNEAKLTESLLPEGAKAVDPSYSLGVVFKRDEWVKVPETKVPGTNVARYGNLAGRYVPGPIWNDLRQMVGLTNQGDLGRVYGKMMRLWKISKTALSPVTHMNNVMSNFVLADMHDIQSRHVIKALRAWATHKKNPETRRLIRDYQDNGGDGGKFNESELNQELFADLMAELERDLNKNHAAELLTTLQAFDLMRHGEVRQAFAALGKTKTAGALTWAPKKMMKLYGVEDEFFRLAAFIKAREDGLDDAAAGKFARESFLNYDINAPWINAARRTFLPFISFTYRAAPMLAQVAADKPWKFAKYAMVAGALNAMAYAMLGDDDDEERERALMPDEKAGKIWGLVPKLMRMPWNDQHGSPVFMDVRRWVPLGDIVDFGQQNSAIPIPPMLMPGGPAVMIGEVVANRSLFTNRDITMQTDTLAEKYGKVSDYLWKSAMPNAPWVPGSYSSEGILKAGSGEVDAFGRERSLGQAALSAAGLKVAAYPRDAQLRNATLDAQAKIREVRADLKADSRQLARGGITQSEFNERMGTKLGKIQGISAELNRKANAGRVEPAEPGR